MLCVMIAARGAGWLLVPSSQPAWQQLACLWADRQLELAIVLTQNDGQHACGARGNTTISAAWCRAGWAGPRK